MSDDVTKFVEFMTDDGVDGHPPRWVSPRLLEQALIAVAPLQGDGERLESTIDPAVVLFARDFVGPQLSLHGATLDELTMFLTSRSLLAALAALIECGLSDEEKILACELAIKALIQAKIQIVGVDELNQ